MGAATPDATLTTPTLAAKAIAQMIFLMFVTSSSTAMTELCE
jgi:hypothetical protein